MPLSKCRHYLALTLAAAALPLQAHHSDAMLDTTRQIELVGHVAGFEAGSPHATLSVEIRTGYRFIDGSPETVTWEIELPPVGELVRSYGIDAMTFTAGDPVRIVALPHRRADQKYAKALRITASHGREYVFGTGHGRLVSQL